MRVALMISASGINGAVVHCHLLIRFLLARGHRVLLVHRPGAWIAARPDLAAAERFASNFSRRPAELIGIARAIRDYCPDVIHTHMSSAHLYGGIARLFGVYPVVATAHAPHFQPHWLLNNRVIATSRPMAEYLRRRNLVAPGKITVLPNFIDVGRLHPPQATERNAVRTGLGIADDAFVVGWVGHLLGYKRPADLVAAFADLADATPRARLLMVGGGPDTMLAELRAIAAARGLGERVILAGQSADATGLMAAMDVLALSSGRETGPLAILEAMARGLPVVATNVGMIPEFVLEGRTGHVIEVGDVRALAQRLTELADDKTRGLAFGRAGREHVARNYALDAVAPRIEAVLAQASAVRNRPVLGFALNLLIGPPKPRDATPDR
ncbi:MAG: glycosyltransferase family 4 protein [Proteobacteria bacterium]|nr:glycosyltransferase family 4 protein [Pseudomonadota bacterium]